MDYLQEINNLLPELKSFISAKVPVDDIGDVVGETWLGIILNAENWAGKSSLKTFIFAIAKNKIADYYRRKYKNKEIMTKLKEQIITNGGIIERQAEDLILKNNLSKSELLVFKLIGLGKSNPEISTILNISGNTVRSHLKKIYQKLGSSDRQKITLIASEYLKIGNDLKSWLEKFFNAYINLGNKTNHLTSTMKEIATKAYKNMENLIDHKNIFKNNLTRD